MKHSPTMWDRVEPGITRLNAMTADEAVETLVALSGSEAWAERIAARRPFGSLSSLKQTESCAWEELSREQLLAAFAKHPRIGESNLHQQRFAASAEQSGREQSGMAGATEEQRREFLAGNEEYERRFGHVFLIRATGRTAAEMLEQLRLRLKNDAETELKNAKRQQHEIVSLRLIRWLST
jgi:OHCU decarboxylase